MCPSKLLPALATALLVNHSVTAQSVDLENVSVYAGGNILFGGFAEVGQGAIVAGGDVINNGGSLEAQSVFGEGAFTTTGGPSFEQISGELYFNGSILDLGGPGSIIGGNVTSATGDVLLLGSSETINGNITAAGRVEQPFSFSAINGNVQAGGDVLIGGSVNGSVTHGGALAFGPFADADDISGGSMAGGPVTPAPFVAPALPAATAASARFNNITLDTFEDITLAPGTYGTLSFESANTVSLSAGTYVFQDIVSDFSLNELAFDVTGGAIEIFIVEPNASLDLIQSINGERLFAGNLPDPALADDITLEVSDSFTLGSDFFGTVFAPNGDITLETFASVEGRVLAGGDLVFEGSNAVNTVIVPEPATAALLAMGGLLLARRRDR